MGNSNDLYGRILSTGPSRDTFFLLLTQMKQEGRFSEVTCECLRALSFYPQDVRLRRLLVESYLELGFMGRAEEELGRVISDIEDLIPSFKLQAGMYARQQRFEEASRALHKYLAHYPDDQEALDLLAEITPVEDEPILETPEIREEPVMPPPEEMPDVEASAEAVEEAAPLVEEPAIPAPGEDVVDELATPTLAEIYYNQGKIEDAINTYEKFLLKSPDDGPYAERLAQLKALVARESEIEVFEADKVRSKEEKLIAILEGWRTGMEDLRRVH